ncbi:MAG TPA: type IV secretory system conjugative DNA transfer family protein [Mucilaginibacter sp.]|jgi:type IV secretory pathway TraG/TraD family ATPase VirD4|nr:type IV secretory system conjugative DNA transfer family protein [Mucilaginibacter sp.]
MKAFLSFILTLLGDLCNSLIDAFEKKKGFNANFGKESDIASRFNKGFLISKHRKLTRRKSFENILLSGPTGSGKTVRLIAKNLFTLRNCSIIINDSSKELFLLVSGHLNQFFNILTLNFSDSTISSGFNVLSRIKKPNDVNKIAHLLVASSLDKGNSSDPFWSLQSKSLLQILIRLILHQPEEYRNMANVLHVLNNFAAQPKKVDVWIAKTKDEKLILDYKALISTPEKTLQNIVASAKAALQLFDDPEIAKTTAYDTIDFDQLRQKPTIIFLQNSISDQKYISILNSIFFEQLYGHILQELPGKNELDTFIILEEASSMYIPMLPLALANTRKHRVGNLICVQSPNQLKTLYKDEADNIASNCVTKIYLPGQTSMEVLRDLESLSGKCIYIDEKKQERVKQLLTVDEIRLLPENRTLILSGNHPFIKGRTSPYYKSLRYKGYAKIPPTSLKGDIPDEPLSLLQ